VDSINEFLAGKEQQRFTHEQLKDPSGTVINSIEMKLVPIRSGTFLMGNHDQDEGENAAHQVKITRPLLRRMFAAHNQSTSP
jgi:formylglycine-generating enzyme required for sulfatase activity